MSYAALARRVNDLAGRQGKALRYDYTAVNRWVKKGQVPREPAPGLIAAALSERLARRVTPNDPRNARGRDADRPTLEYPSDPSAAIESVFDLGVADLAGGEVTAAPFISSAFSAPSRDWLVSVLAQMGDDSRSPGRVDWPAPGRGHSREMFAVFQQMDVLHGGGHARLALLEYMRSYVAPLLRSSQTPEVLSALFEAAAEQAYLVGWMAYDDGMHGLAQRYLIQSLRLAQESGNAALGGHVLAGMSDQANLLGYPGEAVQLARAGLAAAGDSSRACRADLLVLLARALASSGESTAARAAVEKASSEFGRIDREAEPEWARFIDPAYLFGEAAISLRAVGQVAEARVFVDLSMADAEQQGRARRASLSSAVLADSLIDDGELDQAAAVASRVADFAAGVNSSRSRATVRSLASRLRPASGNAEVAAFLGHGHELGLLA